MTDHEPDSINSASAVSDRRRSYSDLNPTAFVKQVVADIAARVASDSPPLNSEARWRLAKFWYGSDATIHYELAVHENSSQLEIGLHAESSPERNRALYAAFDKCLLDVQRELGTSMWLEEWDRGWVRLYETLPLWPLDAARVLDISSRIMEVIAVVQPIYESMWDSPIIARAPSKPGRRR